jgi:flagellar operon protein
LTQAQHTRLETAVDKAAGKGAKDALVMLDETAMVVSVQNRTVITALGMHQAKENVFTNIDSAVIA